MKCEYCQNEIKGKWIYHQRFTSLKILDKIPEGNEVFPMPPKDYVCEECYTDMGITVQ